MRIAAIRLLLTLVCLPLSWGCGGDADSSTREQEISGAVRDAQSGRGIADAVVELTSDALDSAETVSDRDGRFTIRLDVSEGVLFGHVSARHRDYEQAAASSVYFDGTERVLSIELRRKPSK
jgi:hypothetical protein